jgi:hypothetical protein
LGGRRAAGLWTVSYLLYLLFTVDYVVYDLLPAGSRRRRRTGRRSS